MPIRKAPKPITDADIPATIARDTETSAAINTHVAATDPHSQYLLQSEGDARYRLVGALADADIPATIARDSEVTAAISTHVAVADLHTRCKIYNFVTANAEGSTSTVAHGLLANKILGISVIVEGAAGNGAFTLPNNFTNYGQASGYRYIVSISSGNINIWNFPGDSYNLISKPVRAMIWYLP